MPPKERSKVIVGNKIKLSVSLDPELVDWIDKEIYEKVYSSRSHAVESGLFQLKKLKECKR